MNRDAALELIKEILAETVPGADPTVLSPDENFRDILEMDSLDFLNLIEALSGRTGLPLPETDYPSLSTLIGCADYIAARTSPP
ncbi:acyl carrier protein [Streptomyces sp. NBC_00347]|uniref:acyl carrier protein n=1 Tax=Streptomyces sp. NBC_00347 TaxID=2975721 RepID=UPI0022513D7D|nr:acyl carrier protein [Streptomyces sp. NBC_00347]MCX5126930.1 acyl carrier protein [Streptomyces sp. NBC_00347]